MRKDFPSIRSYPDSRVGENINSDKDKGVRLSAIQNYIQKADAAYTTHITDSKKELVFKIPQPKGTCPPSATKTIPGSTTPDRSSTIGNERQMTNLSSLLSSGIKINKPNFPNDGASYSNNNHSSNAGSIYGLGNNNQMCNQFAEMNNSFSNFNIGSQSTQPAKKPILPSYTQRAHSPNYPQSATVQKNPFLKSNSNQNNQPNLHNLINKSPSPQQTLPKPSELSLGQRPANNIFAIPTRPQSNQSKSSNIGLSSTTQPQQTSTIMNTTQQISAFNNNATKNCLDQYSKQQLLQSAQKIFMQNSQQLSTQIPQIFNQNVQPGSQNMQFNNQNVQSLNQNLQTYSQNLQPYNQNRQNFNQNQQQSVQNTQQSPQQYQQQSQQQYQQYQQQPQLQQIQHYTNNPQQSQQKPQQPPLHNALNALKSSSNLTKPTINYNSTQNGSIMQPQSNNLMQAQNNPFLQQQNSSIQSQMTQNPFTSTKMNRQNPLHFNVPQNIQPNQQTNCQMPITTQYSQQQNEAALNFPSLFTNSCLRRQNQMNVLECLLVASPIPVQPSQLEKDLDPEQTIGQLFEQLLAEIREAHSFLLSDIPLSYVDQIQQSRLVSTKFKQLSESMFPQSATIGALQALSQRQELIERELDWLSQQFGPGHHQHPTSELLQSYESFQQIIREWGEQEQRGEDETENVLMELFECLSETEGAILGMEPMLSVLWEGLRWE